MSSNSEHFQRQEAVEGKPKSTLARPKRASFGATSKLFQKLLETPMQAFTASRSSFQVPSTTSPSPLLSADLLDDEDTSERFSFQHPDLEYADPDAQSTLQQPEQLRRRRRDMTERRRRRSQVRSKQDSDSSSHQKAAVAVEPRKGGLTCLESMPQRGSRRDLMQKQRAQSFRQRRASKANVLDELDCSTADSNSSRGSRRDLLRKQGSQSFRQRRTTKISTLSDLDIPDKSVGGRPRRSLARGGSMRDLRMKMNDSPSDKNNGLLSHTLERGVSNCDIKQKMNSGTSVSSELTDLTEATASSKTCRRVSTPEESLAVFVEAIKKAEQGDEEPANPTRNTTTNSDASWDCMSCKDTNKCHHDFCGRCGVSREVLPSLWECTSCHTKDNESRHAYCGGCGKHWLAIAANKKTQEEPLSLTQTASEAA